MSWPGRGLGRSLWSEEEASLCPKLDSPTQAALQGRPFRLLPCADSHLSLLYTEMSFLITPPIEGCFLFKREFKTKQIIYFFSVCAHVDHGVPVEVTG